MAFRIPPIVKVADTPWREPEWDTSRLQGRFLVATTPQGLTEQEVAAFTRDGFVVARGLASADRCLELEEVIAAEIAKANGPVEYEADLGYPGSPQDRSSPGGSTIRRLRQVIDRHRVFADWATSFDLTSCLASLLGHRLVVPLAHHNCVMTKQPRFSSRTGWHQDFRYWSYQRPELVSAWLALGHESSSNGALEIIPGSHALQLDEHRFDAEQFFREDLPENEELIASRQSISLERGDVLLFHCLALHSAGPNTADQVKLSVVFTYRPEDNPPVPGSRSDAFPELSLPRPGGSSPGDTPGAVSG